MPWSWPRRLSRHDAERALAGEPVGSEHPELKRLLAAASAPPHPDELVGEQDAVARFERAVREAYANSAGVTQPVRPRLLVRSVLVKTAAGVALVLLGGSAVAAQTGNLPGGAQQAVHDAWGAPPPRKNKPRLAATPTTPKPRHSPRPGASPSHSPGTSPNPAAASPLLQLCLAWLESGSKKPDKALVKAAGGKKKVPAYCGALLGTPAPSKSPKAKKT